MRRRDAGAPGAPATAAEHLRELRNRVLTALSAFLLVFACLLARGNDVTLAVSSLGREAGYSLVYIAPQELLVQQLKLSALAAFLATFPLAFYEAAAFVAPALDGGPRAGKVAGFFAMGAAMAAAGAAFSARVVLPFALSYFGRIGAATGIAPQVSYGEYVSFLVTVTGAVAMAFELPVACVALRGAGLVDAAGLSKARPAVVIGSFVVGAVITPPDVFTQCMVAAPMWLLYEASVAACRVMDHGKARKERKRIAAEGRAQAAR